MHSVLLPHVGQVSPPLRRTDGTVEPAHPGIGVTSKKSSQRAVVRQQKTSRPLPAKKILPEGDGKPSLPRYHPMCAPMYIAPLLALSSDTHRRRGGDTSERYQFACGYGGLPDSHLCRHPGGASH